MRPFLHTLGFAVLLSLRVAAGEADSISNGERPLLRGSSLQAPIVESRRNGAEQDPLALPASRTRQQAIVDTAIVSRLEGTLPEQPGGSHYGSALPGALFRGGRIVMVVLLIGGAIGFLRRRSRNFAVPSNSTRLLTQSEPAQSGTGAACEEDSVFQSEPEGDTFAELGDGGIATAIPDAPRRRKRKSSARVGQSEWQL